MKAIDTDATLVQSYMKLLEGLSTPVKMDLISKLTMSVKAKTSKRKRNFEKAFGAFESAKSAEEIITEIKKSRRFNRKIEKF